MASSTSSDLRLIVSKKLNLVLRDIILGQQTLDSICPKFQIGVIFATISSWWSVWFTTWKVGVRSMGLRLGVNVSDVF